MTSDQALAMARSCRVIAYDCETTGLDPYGDRIIGHVITSDFASIYVPVRHSGGNNIDDPDVFERELARAFALRSRLGLRTVCHNAGFDLWMAAKQGIVIGDPVDDTMIRAVLVDDSHHSYSLASCAERADVPGKLGAELLVELAKFGRKGEKNVMRHLHRLPGDHRLVVEYAEQDGATTLALWQAQEGAIEDRGLRRVAEVERKLIPHLAALRRRGIRIDQTYADQAVSQVRKELDRMRMHFPADFKVNAKAHTVPWLRQNGVNHFPMTPKGAEGTAKAFLELSEPGLKIIKLRELEKIEGSFIMPLLREHMQKGRIHPELVQSRNDSGRGTHTGRFSCVNPNLQQYPKRNEALGRIVRPLIIPDTGFDLAESDVSQQEPRLYAHYSREESLLTGYNADPPVDVHAITSKLLNIDRDKAKTLGLSIFNGMQAVSLAQRLKVPVSEADNYLYRFFSAYPAIHEFTRVAPIGASQHGYVFTVLGRILHLRWDETRMAVSRIIQGGAADQMKMMLLRACEFAAAYPEKLHVLMSIHDSILWQRRKGWDHTEFTKVLEDNSEFFQIVNGERIPMRVPFPLETRFGRNWAEASYK
ncbi:MAG: DNA polymerase [Tardiphaga sp.]